MTIKTPARAALAAALAASRLGRRGERRLPARYAPPHAQARGEIDQRLARQLAQSRVATAPYVTDLEQAKADGYKIITPMMQDMGFHYLNPGITTST